MFADVAATRGDQSRHTAERAPSQTLAGDLGEEAFDEIQPGRPRRCEMKVEPRMLREPGLHRRMLVRPIVIENEMNVAPPRGLSIDRVQEGQKLGVSVARLTALDHVALEDIQR